MASAPWVPGPTEGDRTRHVKVNQPDAETILKLYVATSDLDGPALLLLFFFLHFLASIFFSVKWSKWTNDI